MACIGVLGYEIDITKLSEIEKQKIAEQVAFYKKYRRLFQFGTFYRLPSVENQVRWQVVSEDRKESVVMLYQRLAIPNPPSDILKLTGIFEEERYKVAERKENQTFSSEDTWKEGDKVTDEDKEKEENRLRKKLQKERQESKEEYDCYGDTLIHAGIKLSQQFSGIGWNEQTRIMGDFSSKLYEVVCCEDDLEKK